MCSAAAPTRMSEGLIGRLVRGPPPDFSPMFTFYTSGTVYQICKWSTYPWRGCLSSRRTSFFLYLDFSFSQRFLSCLALRGRTFGWLLYSVLSFSQVLSLASFE
ncbi:unnamed protein product [Ixodes hexagonus]